MKRFLILLFILVLIVVYSILKVPHIQNEESATILLTKDLGVDSSGEQVAILQSALRSDSSLYTGPVTGFFTVTTKDAVIRFQNKYLLPQTGNMDLVSRLKFNEIFGKNNNLDLSGGSEKWGVAEKVAGTQYGWSMKMENDFVMGNMIDIFNALNTYRLKKKKPKLSLSSSLSQFAQQRSQELNANGGVDEHVGFYSHIRNADNRRNLGFNRFGENTSCGYRMTGTHMIEWIFAGDVPHDENQLSERWSAVGIGVSGTCVSLVFGYNRK